MLKSIKNFIARWGDLTGPVLILLTSIILMVLAAVSRDIFTDSKLGTALSVTQYFENKFYDLRVNSQIKDASEWIDPEISIVEIDDQSLSAIGTWPIPRKNHAQLIRQLQAFGAKVVALDILFPENSQDLSQDEEFAQAISDYRAAGGEVVLSYSLTEHDPEVYPPPEGSAMLETPDFVYSQSGNAQLNEPTRPFWINRYTFPIKKLIETESLMGHIGNSEDFDGVFRHYRITANYLDDMRESVYVGSMALVTAEAFSGEKSKVTTNSRGEAVLTFKGKEIKLDTYGEIKVRYSSRGTNYKTISYHQLLTASPQDEKIRQLIEGKIIMVGSVAEGAHDLRNTPIDPKMPGMYAHTNVTHQLLSGYVYEPTETSLNVSIVMMILGFLIIVITQRFGNALLDIGVLLTVSASVIMLDRHLFLPKGYELKLFYTLACFFNTYSWSTFINFYRSAKEKKQIKGTFARYVSPAIVNEMLDNPEKLKIGGEKRDITCLFSDVRDFTSISEKLTPMELSAALNKYMGRMTDIVFETKGTLDKYIGDAIVAFWGAPLDLDNHPDWAVQAAVKMMEALPAINEDFTARGLPVFKVGIGLNSGECSVGNMGSDKIFSYTALGDNMNLGARLESLCKHYGAEIIISEYTYARLPQNKYRTRLLDKVKVKGKSTPVMIYEVIHGEHYLYKDMDAFEFYNKSYALFLEKKFTEAKTLLEGVVATYPHDKPCAKLMKQCEKWVMAESVPVDFDVTTMTEK